jgi:hypothetical protein
MIHKLHKLNIFPDDDQFHLSHLDLQNRNLLVEVHGDEITMTGILDRDSAIFAPKFMSFKASLSLWDNEDAEEDDENGALSPPQTSEEAEFQRIFD